MCIHVAANVSSKRPGFLRFIAYSIREYVFARGFGFSKARAPLERLHVTMRNVDRSRSKQKGRPGGSAARTYVVAFIAG